jgi:hypothetical protein
MPIKLQQLLSLQQAHHVFSQKSAAWSDDVSSATNAPRLLCTQDLVDAARNMESITGIRASILQQLWTRRPRACVHNMTFHSELAQQSSIWA